MSVTRYYKFTEDDHGTYATHFDYSKITLGEWLPPIEGDLRMCRNGYHVVTQENLSRYRIGNKLYAVEIDDEFIDDGNKICARNIKFVEDFPLWNAHTRVLAAADFAEHVLRIFEDRFPNDDRPRKAIEAARSGANAYAYAAYDAANERIWQANVILEYATGRR